MNTGAAMASASAYWPTMETFPSLAKAKSIPNWQRAEIRLPPSVQLNETRSGGARTAGRSRGMVVPMAAAIRRLLHISGNCGMPSHSLSREIPCDWSRNPAVGLRDPIDARARRRRQGSLEVLPGVLGRAVGDEENVVVPHGQIRFFGNEDLLQVNRYFLAALRSGADEPGRSPRRRRVGALGQRDGLQKA